MNPDRSFESRSQTSYRSTHSSRSSVLERAREYNRRIDEENRKRAKSLERGSAVDPLGGTGSTASMTTASQKSTRSKSAGRVPNGGASSGNRVSTRERAMASVRKESVGDVPHHHHQQQQQQTQQRRGISSSPVAGRSASTPQQPMTTAATTPTAASQYSNHSAAAPRNNHASNNNNNSTNNKSSKPSPSRASKSSGMPPQREEQQQPQQDAAVVSPELLVDALAGHEDGLLAIAEKLMEHYDGGYDVMGEAIIDAFADVQKLFQHVVEAAHMEGAAFEASRRESEIAELRRQAAMGELREDDILPPSPVGSPNGPLRHDEFVDQDVKDVLTEAIRKGATLREQSKHTECYELFETACQAASSLLPVDSDHRSRLQLSVARAESMTPDRACAILRYAMDDVLRSGMRAGRTPLPDPSKRADVVLSRPTGAAASTGFSTQAGVVQSAEEALSSLMEEMKDILSAPVYNDSPLQSVARRFWAALADAQKAQVKNEERLEQSLAKLKGDYLLARAEWEEKLTKANEMAESYKEKYTKLKESVKADGYMEQARSFASKVHDSREDDHDNSTFYGSVRSAASGKAGSVASLGSGLAQQAKTLVNTMNSFNCTAYNDRHRVGGVGMSGNRGMDDLDLNYERKSPHRKHNNNTSALRSPDRSMPRSKSSRTFREYTSSPNRVDV